MRGRGVPFPPGVGDAMVYDHDERNDHLMAAGYSKKKLGDGRVNRDSVTPIGVA
jgi:hypothetical protein